MWFVEPDGGLAQNEVQLANQGSGVLDSLVERRAPRDHLHGILTVCRHQPLIEQASFAFERLKQRAGLAEGRKAWVIRRHAAEGKRAGQTQLAFSGRGLWSACGCRGGVSEENAGIHSRGPAKAGHVSSSPSLADASRPKDIIGMSPRAAGAKLLPPGAA